MHLGEKTGGKGDLLHPQDQGRKSVLGPPYAVRIPPDPKPGSMVARLDPDP